MYKQNIDDIKVAVIMLDGCILDLNRFRYNYYRHMCNDNNASITKEQFYNNLNKLQPVYSLTEGLSQNLVRQAMHNALSAFDDKIYEPMPKEIMSEFSLCSYNFALENIHFPKDFHFGKIKVAWVV